jgi:hypothetical protein
MTHQIPAYKKTKHRNWVIGQLSRFIKRRAVPLNLDYSNPGQGRDTSIRLFGHEKKAENSA